MTLSRTFWEAFRQALLAINAALEVELGYPHKTADVAKENKALRQRVKDLEAQLNK